MWEVNINQFVINVLKSDKKDAIIIIEVGIEGWEDRTDIGVVYLE